MVIRIMKVIGHTFSILLDIQNSLTNHSIQIEWKLSLRSSTNLELDLVLGFDDFHRFGIGFPGLVEEVPDLENLSRHDALAKLWGLELN